MAVLFPEDLLWGAQTIKYDLVLSFGARFYNVTRILEGPGADGLRKLDPVDSWGF